MIAQFQWQYELADKGWTPEGYTCFKQAPQGGKWLIRVRDKFEHKARYCAQLCFSSSTDPDFPDFAVCAQARAPTSDMAFQELLLSTVGFAGVTVCELLNLPKPEQWRSMGLRPEACRTTSGVLIPADIAVAANAVLEHGLNIRVCLPRENTVFSLNAYVPAEINSEYAAVLLAKWIVGQVSDGAE